MRNIFWRFLLVFGLVSTAAYALDVNGELKRALLEKLNADPTGYAGRVYYDTANNVAKFYNGTSWRTFADTAGAFSNPMTTLGDLVYGGAAGAATRLAGNTTNSTSKVLTSTATAGVANAPTLTQIDNPNFFTTGAAASSSEIGIVTTGTQTMGGSKKFTSTGGEVVTAESTGTATSAAVVLQAGNGTTSSRNTFVEMTSLETSPQDWALGMIGLKDWQLKNLTGTQTPITVKTDGKVGIGPGSINPGGGLDVWGPTGGLQILFSENSEKRGGITRTNANGLYIYPNVEDGVDYPTTIWRDGGTDRNTIFRANGDVSIQTGELELAGAGGSSVGSIYSSFFGSANGNALNIKTLNSAGSANTTRIAITGRVNTATIDMTGDVTVSDVMYLGGSVTGAIAQWYGTSGSSQTCNTTCASEPGNVDTDSGNCNQGWTSTGTVTGCATAATNNRCWCIGVRN